MLQAYVSSVSEVCCECFRWILQKKIRILHMLQWLYMYVAKVCSQCFIRVSERIVASEFIWMLHIFHTYVESGCCVRFQVFLQVY
jgi:hypothetical protein